MPKSETSAGRVYDLVRKKAESFEFKPESQINEVTLAASLGTSRTPVREALNRLVAEGFLTFQSRKGFFCRPLGSAQILALYEARIAVECEAIRLAVRKATDEELVVFVNKWRSIEPDYALISDQSQRLEIDEQFHTEIASLSKNPELERMLANLNGRIRFVRLVDQKYPIGNDGSAEQAAQDNDHKNILTCLAARNEEAAASAMRKHIESRREQTIAAVTRAFAEIYSGV